MNQVQNSIEEVKDKVVRESQSGEEPPSGKRGAGTLDSPYDAGNAPENPGSSIPSTSSNKPVDTSVESPSTTHQGSGLPEQTPTEAQSQAIKQSTEKSEAVQKGVVGAGNGGKTQKSTGVAASGGNFDAAQKGAGKEADRLRNLEREVSPGTRDDGTHVRTSGEKGESYEPSKMSKFKGKLHMGSGR